MAICYADQKLASLPSEARLLDEVVVRLVADEAERHRHDELLAREHYLHQAQAIGQVLRYVAGYRGEWVAALTFCSAALHLKARDQFLHWPARRVKERRHLLAQNSRFLVLPSTGRWPNLASRVLTLACARLPQDWQQQFGHPVLLVETFVDPQRFRGTCYRAANWQALGRTQGFARRGQDYYTDTEHPKELWIQPLGRNALAQLRAPELAAALRAGGPALPPPVPVPTAQLGSLAAFLRRRVSDPRDPHGIRHRLGSVIATAALAIAAGCQGPHAIAKFARSLNHGQRRRLGCRPRPGARHTFDVPCERTFARLLAPIDPDQLRQAFTDWMATLDPTPLTVVHLDGKVLRNADPAPPRLAQEPALVAAAAALDTPVEQQKPKAQKALTLVNFQTPGQRLIDQIAVPQDTNEEAAVAAHLSLMDLTGVLVIGDAAHTIKANCRLLTQEQGADYLFFLKGNQPHAFAKAQQLLAGDLPPQAQTSDKGHGRVEGRQLWSQAVDGALIGLAGAAQIFRLDHQVDYLRKGDVYKTTQETRYGVLSLSPEEAGPDTVLALVRDYWGIEIRQHYRRDHTQREDHCQVRHSVTARNLSLMRSLAIFLYEQQRGDRNGQQSLPDWQRQNHRQPNALLARFTAGSD